MPLCTDCTLEAEEGRARCARHLALNAATSPGAAPPRRSSRHPLLHSQPPPPDRGACRWSTTPWPELPEGAEPPRPRTRGDCVAGPRPCPWVSCKHHLMLDVNPETGHLKIRFSDIDEMPETCALDVAEQGGIRLEEVGRHVGVTLERARQIEAQVLLKMRDAESLATLAAEEDDIPAPPPRAPTPPKVVAPQPVQRTPAVSPQRGRGYRLSVEEQAAIEAVIREGPGLSCSEIVRRCGCAHTTVRKIAAKMGVTLGQAWTEEARRAHGQKIKESKGVCSAAKQTPVDDEPKPQRPMGAAPDPRRAEAWALMAQGLRNVEISDRLGAGRQTVSTWRVAWKKRGESAIPDRAVLPEPAIPPPAAPASPIDPSPAPEPAPGIAANCVELRPVLACGYRGTCGRSRQEGADLCEYHAGLAEIRVSVAARQVTRPGRKRGPKVSRDSPEKGYRPARAPNGREAELLRVLEFVKGCLVGSDDPRAQAAMARIDEMLGDEHG